jgi:phenylalanyl-tRNA synthetase beta chain
LLVDGQPVGSVGEIDPRVLDRFAIGERVAWLDVDLEAILARSDTDRRYQPISRFPTSDVDLAFEVDETTPAAAVEATIVSSAGPLAATVELFDIYRGSGTAQGRRSLAYRLRLQAPDRTLTDTDIAAVRTAVIDAVTAAHPADLRA